MKNFYNFLNELPRGFAFQARQLFPYVTNDVQFNCMPEFLEYITGRCEDQADATGLDHSQTQPHQWRELKKRYDNDETTTFHVSYYTEPSKGLPFVRSTGENVQAFDLIHAVDIVIALRGVKLNNISYVHSKEACCKLRKQK